jgi:hypothetical protein
MKDTRKVVSLFGFSGTANEMQERIEKYAERVGMKDDILHWGGRGDAMPFIVVACTEKLAAQIQCDGAQEFPGARIAVEDYPQPLRKHHHGPHP